MESTIGACYRFLCLFTVVVLLATAQPLNAQPHQGGDCSYLVVNRSFSQAFGGFLNVPLYFNSLGVTPPPGIGLVPTGGAGFVTFLPHNKLAGQVTLAIGQLGLIQDLVVDSTTSEYSLSWDTSNQPAVCSGTMILNTSGEAPFNFQVVVNPDGPQIHMVHTDAALIVGVIGFPIETSRCSNRTLNGTYSYTINGWELAGGQLPLPPETLLAGYFTFVMSGTMRFGNGSIAFSDSGSLDGIIYSRTGTGSYSEKDCTAAATLTDSLGNHFNVELFVGQDAKALYMVDVDEVPGTPLPMWIFGGTLTRMSGRE